MTITTSASDVYEQKDDAVVDRRTVSVPKLAVLGLSLFAANIAVLGGFAMSPELKVGVYGDDSPTAYNVSADKPSPFTLVVDTNDKPRKARVAERVRPVLQQDPVMAYENTNAAAQPVDLTIPRASQQAAAMTTYTAPSSRTTVSGDAAYRKAESYGDFRRVTAMSQELVPPTSRRVTN
jgi:hypothetical protein